MSGVGHGHGSIWRDGQAEAGDEDALVVADHDFVHLAQEDGRRDISSSHGAQGADGDGSDHGGLEAFAGDISHDDQNGTVVPGKDLTEVAADLFRGEVGDIGLQVAVDGLASGDEAGLNFAGGLERGGESLLFAADAREAVDHHEEVAEEQEQVDRVHDSDLEGTGEEAVGGDAEENAG